jgi:hypothetical protein
MEKDFERFGFVISGFDALEEGVQRGVSGECRHCE